MDTEMIEISVQISALTTYDIMIPKVITPNKYPEVMKRLKAIHGMIPKVGTEPSSSPTGNLLKLEEEETADVIRLYETSEAEAFSDYLVENYGLEKKTRANITSMIGRMRKRLGGMHSSKKLHAKKSE